MASSLFPQEGTQNHRTQICLQLYRELQEEKSPDHRLKFELQQKVQITVLCSLEGNLGHFRKDTATESTGRWFHLVQLHIQNVNTQSYLLQFIVREAVTQKGKVLFTRTPTAASIIEALAPPWTHLKNNYSISNSVCYISSNTRNNKLRQLFWVFFLGKGGGNYFNITHRKLGSQYFNFINTCT